MYKKINCAFKSSKARKSFIIFFMTKMLVNHYIYNFLNFL